VADEAKPRYLLDANSASIRGLEWHMDRDGVTVVPEAGPASLLDPAAKDDKPQGGAAS
jgi:hypothetical protein